MVINRSVGVSKVFGVDCVDFLNFTRYIPPVLCRIDTITDGVNCRCVVLIDFRWNQFDIDDHLVTVNHFQYLAIRIEQLDRPSFQKHLTPATHSVSQVIFMDSRRHNHCQIVQIPFHRNP
ncbi:hypothetical protein D9M70_460160 [compost metagenome]